MTPPLHRDGGDGARLARCLERIGQGDGQARNDLLTAYAPYALSVASRATGRFIRLGEDDEANIALIALDEAARTFVAAKGSFLPFASQVIRRRLIDYLRHQGRRSTEIPAGVRFAPGDPEMADDQLASLETTIAVVTAREYEESEARKHELLAYSRELSRYGLTFDELARVAPRHRDARDSAKDVARVLAADPAMRKRLIVSKQLPLRELQMRTGVGRKSLERHRKYIIAVALILMGDYELLSEYVSG